MAATSFIKTPNLWSSHSETDRRVTWMELFFDLIFVAAISQVGMALQKDYGWEGLFRYLFLFVLIWSAWIGHTIYSTRFDTDDLVQRVSNLVQCFIAAVMAANSQDALDSRSSAGFGAAYAGLRIVLVLQYLRARKVPETRALTTRYAIGFGVASLLWLLSAVLPVPLRFWCWAVAMTVDLLTPLWTAKESVEFPTHSAHFPERLGIFTIILLGEFVAAVMRGIKSQENWSPAAAITAFTSLAFAFVIWWWYFDRAQGAAERSIHSRNDRISFRIWNYSHLPLFLGIGVASVGFEKLISSGGLATLPSAASRITVVSTVFLMLALTAIGSTSEAVKQLGRLRFAAPHLVLIACLATLTFYAERIPSVWFVVILVAFGVTHLSRRKPD